MDIIRRRAGLLKTRKGRKVIKTIKFRYINKTTGKTVKDYKTIKRIKSLRIPPAYNRVTISNNSRSKIQAIGVDDKKRKQSVLFGLK